MVVRSCTGATPGSGVASQGCSALLCSAQGCSALLQRTPLCFGINLNCSHWQPPLSEQQWQAEYGQGRCCGQPAIRPICQLQVNSGPFSHISVRSISSWQAFPFCNQHFTLSGEGNARGLKFAMPLLRGKDESDAAVAAAAAGQLSGRLGAEADGAAAWLDGGGSQRGHPGPGLAGVRLPLPVHLLPLPAAPGYWGVWQWAGSPEGSVHCPWSSLPFPC